LVYEFNDVVVFGIDISKVSKNNSDPFE